MKLSAVLGTGLVLLSVATASAQGVSDSGRLPPSSSPRIRSTSTRASWRPARSNNADIKKFAETMVNNDSGVNKQATELVTKLQVTPQDNPTSQALKAGGEKNLANLKGLKGAAFDKAYIDHEVAYHEQVLEAVDETLIPSAQNADLKALLVKVRPAFVALEHAKHVQSSLGTR